MDQNILPQQIKGSSQENAQLAHDLRNALNSILLYAQILEVSLAKLSLESEKETAHLISDSVKEMEEMINKRFATNENS